MGNDIFYGRSENKTFTLSCSNNNFSCGVQFTYLYAF